MLPNVIAVAGDLPPASAPPPLRLLFVGNMGYWPNRDAVRFLIDEIVPALRRRLSSAFELQLVGSGRLPAAWTEQLPPEVRWSGHVQDLQSVYATSHVVLAPIRTGGGTRVKILEAFAYGRPVVATRLGAEGLAAQPGRHLWIGDTADEIARACEHIHATPDQARRIGERTRAWVRREHGHSRLIDVLRPRR